MARSTLGLVGSPLSVEGIYLANTSFHMMGDKELFSSLEKKNLHMHIEMGEDRRYSAIGIGLVLW